MLLKSLKFPTNFIYRIPHWFSNTVGDENGNDDCMYWLQLFQMFVLYIVVFLFKIITFIGQILAFYFIYLSLLRFFCYFASFSRLPLFCKHCETHILHWVHNSIIQRTTIPLIISALIVLALHICKNDNSKIFSSKLRQWFISINSHQIQETFLYCIKEIKANDSGILITVHLIWRFILKTFSFAANFLIVLIEKALSLAAAIIVRQILAKNLLKNKFTFIKTDI